MPAYSSVIRSQITPYGLKGITGYRRTMEDGSTRLILLLTTYHSTSCTASAPTYCSALLSWDATNITDGSTFIAAPSSLLQHYAGVVMAPIAPTPSSSATASQTPSSSQTPSGTPPATPSLTQGASPSSTGTPAGTPSGTGTPTLSLSATVTPTQTATPSATNLCSDPAVAPRAFTLGSVVALRVGSGRDPLGTTTAVREVFLDEYSPVNGQRLQSIALPTGPAQWTASGAIATAGCGVVQSYHDTGYLTRSDDGTQLVIPCLSTPVGTLYATTLQKALGVVRYDGSYTAEALHTFSTGYYRSATMANGRYYFTTASGTQTVPRGNNISTAAVSMSSGTHRQITVFDNTLYSISTSTTGSVLIIGGTAGVIPTASPAPAAVALPGVANGYSTSAAAVFAPDGLSLWLSDYSTAAGTLSKFVRSSTAQAAPWTKAWTYGNFTVSVGGAPTVITTARGMTGWTDASTGTFFLIAATPGGLVKFNTITETSTLLAAPCDSTTFRGVALSPIQPSISATPTATPPSTGTPTASPPSTASSTVSVTGSVTGTPPSTASGTPSLTRSGTPSNTVSTTGSVSATASETASISSSQTGTASPSATHTAAATDSSSITAAATASHTGAPSRSAQPSATGTKSRLPSPTRSKTSTPSKVIIPSFLLNCSFIV